MSEPGPNEPLSSNGEIPAAAATQDLNIAQENQNEQQPQQQQPPSKFESFLSITKSLIVRALIIYFISTLFRGQKPQPQPGTDVKTQTPAARNLFVDGAALNLYVYLSEKDTLQNYSDSNLFWFEDIIYADWNGGIYGDGTFVMEKEVPITPGMKNNGSLFLHAFVTRRGLSPDPKAKNYAKQQQTSFVKQINKYRKLKSSTTKNLLTGETDKDIVEDGKIISHWHPNFTINLVADQALWNFGSVPSPVDKFIQFTEDHKFYTPILYPNDFWNMARDYKPLNDSLHLRVTFQPLSMFKWQMYLAQQRRNSMFSMWDDSPPEQSDDEQDTLKETLMDTNPYLLGITIAVSILHSIFELLAFKNDIQFWNNRNSLEGLSVRSVFFGVFQSVVILLYVLDNDTNTMVKISCFVGLAIELWKIAKVVDIKFENGRITFKDKGSYVESSTRQYDQLAFKYLSWLCFPLLAGYSVYALLYLEHKGWYSFVLDLLYGYLLTFGFIMMTPQLFINYKLKSVAHLPWRMLTYKFLNTFIDDMFAFVIKMPTMYRIGCFRDDIIFLIFLYQKWIYPVDKSRHNEFGYSPEQEEKKKSIENNTETAETKKSQ